MLLPPPSAQEILIYRASYFKEYEVFVFPVDIGPVLELYEKGLPIDVSVSDKIKSYLFESVDGIGEDSRTSLANWMGSVGLFEPEATSKAASSWRLIYANKVCRTIPRYQGHPVRTSEWDRTPIQVKTAKKAVDMFDPLMRYIDDVMSGS